MVERLAERDQSFREQGLPVCSSSVTQPGESYSPFHSASTGAVTSFHKTTTDRHEIHYVHTHFDLELCKFLDSSILAENTFFL